MAEPTLSRLTDPNLELISTHLFSTSLPQLSPTESHPDLQPPQSHIHFLPYGIDRLLSAAAAFNFPAVTANLSQPDRAAFLAQEIQTHILQTHGEDALDPEKRFIVRIAFRRDGELRLMSAPRPHSPGVPYYPTSLPPPLGQFVNDDVVPVIPLHLDTSHVPSSLFTTHKTSHRADYDAARERVGFDESVTFAMGEMLLRNERGEIMGGGVTSVYFWREGAGWVTPAEETGCKMGVSRRWAVERAGVGEGVVLADEVGEGEEVWVSSAVAGWRRGRVTLRPRGGG